MKYAYSVQIFRKDGKNPDLWFQNGKLLPFSEIDKKRDFGNYRHFRTKEKLDSFITWADKIYPDIIVQIENLNTRKISYCVLGDESKTFDLDKWYNGYFQ